MTITELEQSMRGSMNESMVDLVKQNTKTLCDAYQRGWVDAMELFNTMAKERGFKLW